MARVFPHNRGGRLLRRDGRMVVLHAYHGHMTCVFPQHGSGKTHHRRVVLEPWQREHVAAAPWAFLRGCIRSDGCVFLNRTGSYVYESCDVANLSADIRRLFAETCRSVGVDCRVYARRVRIYRRASVALMLEHVGRKQ